MKNNSNDVAASDTNETEPSRVTRRKFFGDLGKATATVAALGAATPLIDKGSAVHAGGKDSGSFYHQRALGSYQFRVKLRQSKLCTDTAEI